MSAFELSSTNGNSVSFTSEEATDTGFTKPFYGILIGEEESAGSRIKQQIRPGKRFNKIYRMKLSETQYIDFMNMLTDQSEFYYIEYTTAPSLLDNDSEIVESNNFKVNLSPSNVDNTLGSPLVYSFDLHIKSTNLL